MTLSPNCINKATVISCVDSGGGVCGYNSETAITDCKNEGSIYGWLNVGGISGNSSGGLTRCENTGTVFAWCYVGGIVGSASSSSKTGMGAVKYCANSGYIKCGNAAGGGIIGINNGSIVSDCCNTADVNGSNTAGGLVGTQFGKKISNCYTTGYVTASSNCGKAIGYIYESDTVEGNIYYLASNINDDDGVVGTTAKTASQFASGEVAYLLNSGVTNGTETWYQNINNGETPDGSPRFTGGTVYGVDVGYSNTYSSNCVESADATKTNVDMTNRFIMTTLTNNRTFDGILNTLSGFTVSALPSFGTDISPFYGTGTVISFNLDGVKKAEYTLVVKGDIDGDSVCDVLDCFKAEQAVNNNVTLNATETLASDYDSNGSISVTDYQNLVNTALS